MLSRSRRNEAAVILMLRSGWCSDLRYHQSSIPTTAPMEASSLTALSPVDGRYAAAAAPLRRYFSEAGLVRERIRIEALWFRTLVERVSWAQGAIVPPAVLARAAELAAD